MNKASGESVDRVKEWATALRSGEFRQGRHQLRNNDGYCCLGVLCVLYARDSGESEDELFDMSESFPPSEVYNWLEKDLRNNFTPEFALKEAEEVPLESALANMNDEGKSFMEIADFIDKFVTGLPNGSQQEEEA